MAGSKVWDKGRQLEECRMLESLVPRPTNVSTRSSAQEDFGVEALSAPARFEDAPCYWIRRCTRTSLV